MLKALVLGAGGFIGSHMVNKLKDQGFWVRGVDLKYPEFEYTSADEFLIRDLRRQELAEEIIQIDGSFDEVYQFAADMGGAGYVFTGEHDADIMHNSAQINLNVATYAVKHKVKRLFYSGSACMYPAYNQEDPLNPNCKEESAYPAAPDSEYGWEKLFSERLYLSYAKNYGLNVHICRYHNIMGTMGTYKGGKEKSPAALCRKVILAPEGGEIEVWGPGSQTRSFLYIDECIEATQLLMRSDFTGPVNIGSEEMVTINELAEMIIDISGKNIKIKNIPGPVGVNGRNSDNTLIREKLSWDYKYPLKRGLILTYDWIQSKIKDGL